MVESVCDLLEAHKLVDFSILKSVEVDEDTPDEYNRMSHPNYGGSKWTTFLNLSRQNPVLNPPNLFHLRNLKRVGRIWRFLQNFNLYMRRIWECFSATWKNISKILWKRKKITINYEGCLCTYLIIQTALSEWHTPPEKSLGMVWVLR
jgi:hypothetical protein